MKKLLILVALLAMFASRAEAQLTTTDVLIFNTGNSVWQSGTGSPEGAQTGNPNWYWIQTDAPYDLWRKASGTGNTGWVKVGGTPSALTKTDDTNVTLTFGGTPLTSLLQDVSITLGWTGTLSPARGGSGAGSFTLNGVIYGNATSAFGVTAAGGANTVLTANGGAPSFSDSPTIKDLTLMAVNPIVTYRPTIIRNLAAGVDSYASAWQVSPFDGSSHLFAYNATAYTPFYIWSSEQRVESGARFKGNVLPSTTDTYTMGDADQWWSQGYISRLNAVVFALTTQTLFGGYSTIGKNAGTFSAAVANSDTTINFGTSMTVGDFVQVKAANTTATNSTEHITVGSLVSGTTYNVTRNLSGAGAENWAGGVPFLVLGQSGDGRIDMLAYDGKPRIVFTQQGATYNAQTPRTVIGNLNTYCNYVTDVFGFCAGDKDATHVTIDDTNGFLIKYGGTTKVAITAAGAASFSGSISAPSGDIGGFSLGADYIRDAANTMGFASTVTGGDDVRGWAGAAFADRATAPLRWTESGLMTLTGATIAGPIVTLGVPGTPSSSLAYARPASNGFGQTGDIFGVWTFAAAVTEQWISLQNVVKGDVTSPAVSAHAYLSAQGWTDAGAGSSTDLAEIKVRSQTGTADISLSVGGSVRLSTTASAVTASVPFTTSVAAIQKQGPFVDIRAYGALTDATCASGGNATTNDTAFANAIAAAAYGTVYVPAGIWRTSVTINMTTVSQVRIMGAGQWLTSICSSVSGSPAVTVSSYSTRFQRLEQLAINWANNAGAIPATQTAATYGIFVNEVGYHLNIESVHVAGFPYHAIGIYGRTGPVMIRDSSLQSNAGYGVYLFPNASSEYPANVMIDGGNIQHQWGGIKVEGGQLFSAARVDIELGNEAIYPCVWLGSVTDVNAVVLNGMTCSVGSSASISAGAAVIFQNSRGTEWVGGLVQAPNGVHNFLISGANSTHNSIRGGYYTNKSTAGGYFVAFTNGTPTYLFVDNPDLNTGSFTSGLGIVNDVAANLVTAVGVATATRGFAGMQSSSIEGTTAEFSSSVTASSLIATTGDLSSYITAKRFTADIDATDEVDASMVQSASRGLFLQTVAGSAYDFTLMTPSAAAYIMTVATGTSAVRLHNYGAGIATFSSTGVISSTAGITGATCSAFTSGICTTAAPDPGVTITELLARIVVLEQILRGGVR